MKRIPKPPPESKPRAAAETCLSAALDYARRGWAVFPCHVAAIVGFGCDRVACSCRDRECTAPGKHPRIGGGFHSATIDPSFIRAWWARSRWPDANVAIATGGGLMAVDIDPRKGGGRTLAKLEAEHGPFPREAAVFTGGGGVHVYYQYSGVPIGSGSDVLGTGGDVKAEGGYVIAPPSLHASGRRYRWLRGAMPAKFPVAPDWLVKLALSGAPRAAGNGRGRPANGGDAIATADHAQGQRIAQLIGAEDRKTYWKFCCPVHDDEHASAAMYPRPDGQVFFKCFAGCGHDEIARVLMTRGKV